jgi:hypothetical protein
MVAAFRAGKQVDAWRGFPTYRIELIEPDQPVVLWVTGPTGARPEPGIRMAGYTTGQILENSQGDEYWLDEAEREKRRPYIGVRMSLVDPVPRQRLTQDPRTRDMEVLRVPRISNPSFLTHEEKQAVEEMMGGWPEPPR